MPDITFTRYPVPLSRSDDLTEILDGLTKMTARQVDEAVRRNDASISRARRLIGEAKVGAVAKEILERAEAGHSGILVGAWHHGVINGLSRLLADKRLSVATLTGSTRSDARREIQASFNQGTLDVLIAQISAAGVAIDLQHGGNNILVIEEDWSPDVMDQFYARMYRMGQTQHVHVDTYYADNELEAAIHRIADKKAGEHKRLMNQPHD